MNLRNTNDIKMEALQMCGELTDGTSPFDTVCVKRLNEGYKKIFSGGNVFGVDVSDPFTWATAQRPMTLVLQTEFVAGSVTLTNGSYTGTFSSIPVDPNGNQVSVKGWYLKTQNYVEYLFIRKHDAGSLTFQIDQKWFQPNYSGNFTVFPLEYDLTDDTVIIDVYNNRLDFQDSGSILSATLTTGVYDVNSFSTLVAAALNAAASTTLYSCSFNAQTRMFTVSRGTGSFSILAASGANWQVSAWPTLKFTVEDKTNITSATSDSVFNGIQRLHMAMNMYRSAAPAYLAPEDSGKIYGIDLTSMLKKFPLTQIFKFMPEKFAEVHRRDNGVVRVRFNSYPLEQTRIEVPYIPIPEILADNTASIPKIQESYRKFLVYYAAYFIQIDKSDDRAPNTFQLAVAELQSMVNDYRSNTERTNNTFAKLIPRPSNFRTWRTNWNV